MRAKELLKSVRYADDKIKIKQEEIERLNGYLHTARGRRTDKTRVQEQTKTDEAEAVQSLIDLKKELAADIKDMANTKKKVKRIIDSMEAEDDEKIILYKRYFEKKSFEKIAIECHYSWRWTHTLHSRALAAFEKKFNCS